MTRSLKISPDDSAGPPTSRDGQSALAPGTRLGDMEIVRVLAVGGFGIVYLAHDTALNRNVAVKEFMPSRLVSRGQGQQVVVRAPANGETYALALRSFVDEARLLARLSHPAIVKVYHFWEANGTGYMVMPYHRGPTLSDLRRSMSEAPTEGWLRSVIDPLLDVLDLLHAQQLYHRDVSPDNVLLTEAGTPVLLDFGAARHVVDDQDRSVTTILRQRYSPIEQYGEAENLRQGPWTDLYALAALAAYMIKGTAPPPSTARASHDEMAPLAKTHIRGISTPFLAALDWALSVRPQDRPQSVAQFRAALQGRVGAPQTSDVRTAGLDPGLAVSAPVSVAAQEHPADDALATPRADRPPRRAAARATALKVVEWSRRLWPHAGLAPVLRRRAAKPAFVVAGLSLALAAALMLGPLSQQAPGGVIAEGGSGEAGGAGGAAGVAGTPALVEDASGADLVASADLTRSDEWAGPVDPAGAVDADPGFATSSPANPAHSAHSAIVADPAALPLDSLPLERGGAWDPHEAPLPGDAAPALASPAELQHDAASAPDVPQALQNSAPPASAGSSVAAQERASGDATTAPPRARSVAAAAPGPDRRKPTQTSRSKSSSAKRVAQAGPIELCADRSFFARPFCQQRLCNEGGYAAHPQCIMFREIARNSHP
jgi:hypothetical protein